MNRRSCSSASTSFSKARSATPERVVWVTAPPSSSWRHGLVGHRLHHVGAGDEHVGAVLHHEDEVGHRRRIDGAAGAGAHDRARSAARRPRPARCAGRPRHSRRARRRPPGCARRRESLRPTTGAPTFIAWSMTLQIFSACASRERAAEHGEILAEGEDQAAVHRAVAGDDAVARDLLLGHAEIVRAVLDEHVPFLEGAGIEQQLEPLARGELALGVLRLRRGARRRRRAPPRAYPRAGEESPASALRFSAAGAG